MSENENNLMQKPVIFLAFANDRVDDEAYLRNLPQERSKVFEILDRAEKNGLCEVIPRPEVTIDNIFDVFRDERYRDRIAIFHFAGHANSYQLLLETKDGKHSPAHQEGLVSFLARQKGLKFVFLNGCSTKDHANKLTEAGIPATAGTFQDILDEAATELAIRFYKGIADNKLNLAEAWQDAVDLVKSQKGKDPSRYRRANWQGKREKQGDFPWGLYYDKNHPEVLEWKLPEKIPVNPPEKPLYSDLYSPYENGMEKLLQKMGKNHPRYSDALLLQGRLLENIKKSRRFGDNESREAQRVEIFDQLNQLALSILDQSFNHLCN